MREKVKIQLVIRWTCPHCEHVNHHTGKPLDPDTAESLEDDQEDPAEFKMAPDVLFCHRCEGQFEPDTESL